MECSRYYGQATLKARESGCCVVGEERTDQHQHQHHCRPRIESCKNHSSERMKEAYFMTSALRLAVQATSNSIVIGVGQGCGNADIHWSRQSKRAEETASEMPELEKTSIAPKEKSKKSKKGDGRLATKAEQEMVLGESPSSAVSGRRRGLC